MCRKFSTSPGRKVYPLLTRFQRVFENGLKNIILSSKSKSCSLDALPTWLLKNCIDVLLPTITTIINTFLDQDIFPSQFKRSLVPSILSKRKLLTLTISVITGLGLFPIYLFFHLTLERIVPLQID